MRYILFVYGSIIGSFLTLMVERIITNREFVWSRSQCDNCQRTLSWFELIPIISFIVLRGKCQRCNVKLPYYLLIYEVMTGLLVSLYSMIPNSLLILAFCFEIISLFDLFTFKFNIYWLPIVFSLALWSTNLNLINLFLLLIIYVILLVINSKLNWLGNGDLDLIICLILACGLVTTIHIIFYASFVALGYCLFRKTKVIPFIPFLANSLIVVLFIESFPVTM
ncbi:prepilin peptidase [Fructilactobacillus sp. Tb1]|uniref:prepilin peptidase n=1 Tax=Fructilactobacillus sp. Tb1 TaxID=3422304 RepID=UPI003D2CE8C0